MCIFCCDIGGTFTKWGIFENGELISKGEFKSNVENGGRALIQAIINHIPLLIENRVLEGISISSAGTINDVTGVVTQASNAIPGYQGTNIKGILEEAFGVDVFVENDVNAAMYAEAVAGAGKDHDIVFGMTLGTGVGSAIIINKKIYHGSSYFAGEIGYLPINGNVLDLSGSTRGLVGRVASRKKEDVSLWDGKRVFEGIASNDTTCLEELQVFISSVIQAMILSICFINPSVIILGGGVMAQKNILLPMIKEGLKQSIPDYVYNKIDVCATEFGNYAGVYGAYYLYLDKKA